MKKKDLSPNCRFCKSAYCRSIGNIADSDMFAGAILSNSLKGGRLWLCQNCHSMFRYPILSEIDYLALYSSVDADIWESNKLRKDQELVLSTIQSTVKSGKVLDIGCFAGQLLNGLPEQYEKYGVEPSVKAAEVAANKGINVLGPTIDNISLGMKYDCIVSVDVLEHIINPVDFLSKTLQMLNPQGVLILSTGNPSSFAWRNIFKSRFWYVTNAEHVSFLSQKFLVEKVREFGAEVQSVHNFKYADYGLKKTLVKLFGQVLFAISPRLYALRRGAVDGSQYPSIYSLGVFKDHHIVTIRKTT